MHPWTIQHLKAPIPAGAWLRRLFCSGHAHLHRAKNTKTKNYYGSSIVLQRMKRKLPTKPPEREQYFISDRNSRHQRRDRIQPSRTWNHSHSTDPWKVSRWRQTCQRSRQKQHSSDQNQQRRVKKQYRRAHLDEVIGEGVLLWLVHIHQPASPMERMNIASRTTGRDSGNRANAMERMHAALLMTVETLACKPKQCKCLVLPSKTNASR